MHSDRSTGRVHRYPLTGQVSARLPRIVTMFDRSAVRDLDTAQVLEAAVERRAAADRAEADLLLLAVHFADLNPVLDEPNGDPGRPAGWASRSFSILGPPQVVPLAGDGTPPVEEFAPDELATALGISSHAGLQLVADALELCFRLPRLWALVQDGHLQAWRARKVAAETTHLSRAAVDFVDRHLATVARHNKLPRVKALIHEALLHCDPDLAEGIEQAALHRRGVALDHRESTATTTVHATMDTPDALALDATIAQIAGSLARLGDSEPLDIRRARALGILGNPHHALHLLTNTTDATPTSNNATGTGGGTDGTNGTDGTDGSEGTGGTGGTIGTVGTVGGAGTVGTVGTAATVYLHINAADLASGGIGGVGAVEGLGPATLHLLRDWLQRASGVTIRPVLDLNRTGAVDSHDAPGWMRCVVQLRDRHCVFPNCRVIARRCDLDHLEPYVSPDDGGPPGQTTPDNLACLCRRHHRLKTFGRWTYRRTAAGTYVWTTPHQWSYDVSTGDDNQDGTRRLA
jgi:hypothetical protein